MAVTTQRLFLPVQLGTSLGTLFTATARTILDKLSLCNATASSVTGIDVHIVPSGGTASIATRVISGKSLAANETYLCPELVGHTMEIGEFVQAIASTASAVSARGSGRVVT